MSIKPNLLLIAMADELAEIDSTIGKLQLLSYQLSLENSYYNEENEMTESELKWRLERTYIGLSLLMEHLSLNQLLSNFQTGFSIFKGKLDQVAVAPYFGDFYSEAQIYLRQYLHSLSALLGEDLATQDLIQKKSTLEGILLNTPKIIFDRGIEPQNEAQVRKSVYDLLIHVFPDTVRETSIVQNTKTYKPDIGVKSLSTAIEYKFADSLGEAKAAVGGLY